VDGAAIAGGDTYGDSASDSTAPRLSATVNTFSDSRNALAWARPPCSTTTQRQREMHAHELRRLHTHTHARGDRHQKGAGAHKHGETRRHTHNKNHNDAGSGRTARTLM
jgi:hypothetical protein